MNRLGRFKHIQSHLDLAHSLWQGILLLGDRAFDATLGQGYDAISILKQVGSEGMLYGCDVQEKALETSRARIIEELGVQSLKCTQFELRSHAEYVYEIKESLKGSHLKLAVFNLGYLPGSNKEIKTKPQSTCQALLGLRELIAPGGAISVTSYIGHSGGEEEYEALMSLLKEWSPKEWSVLEHRWQNRSQAPRLIWIQRAL